MMIGRDPVTQKCSFVLSSLHKSPLTSNLFYRLNLSKTPESLFFAARGRGGN